MRAPQSWPGTSRTLRAGPRRLRRAASGPATPTSHGTKPLVAGRFRRRGPCRGDPCGRPRRANAGCRFTETGRHKGVPYIRPNGAQPYIRVVPCTSALRTRCGNSHGTYAAGRPRSPERAAPFGVCSTEAPHSRPGASLPLCAGFASGPATPTSHGTTAAARCARSGVCSMRVSTPGPGRGRARNNVAETTAGDGLVPSLADAAAVTREGEGAPYGRDSLAPTGPCRHQRPTSRLVPWKRPKAGPALRFAMRQVRLRPSHADLPWTNRARSLTLPFAFVPWKRCKAGPALRSRCTPGSPPAGPGTVHKDLA